MTHRLSMLGFAATVAALAALVVRGELFSPHPLVIALQLLGFAFMVWARIAFGRRSFHPAADTTEGALVTTGPYAIVRNPIYAGMLLVGWAGAGAHLGLASAALALVMLGGTLLRVFAEERELRAEYEDAYAAYCKRVKRLVPGVF